MLLLIIVYVYWGLQTATATAATLRFCFASLSFPEVTPDKLGSWRSPKESYCCCNIFCRPDALPITQPTVSKHWMKVSLSALTAILPGEPGLAGFMEAKDDGSGVIIGAISRVRLQSNHHHQQTNIQLFTGQKPFLSPNQQCQSTDLWFANYLFKTSTILKSLPCLKEILHSVLGLLRRRYVSVCAWWCLRCTGSVVHWLVKLCSDRARVEMHAGQVRRQQYQCEGRWGRLHCQGSTRTKIWRGSRCNGIWRARTGKAFVVTVLIVSDTISSSSIFMQCFWI